MFRTIVRNGQNRRQWWLPMAVVAVAVLVGHAPPAAAQQPVLPNQPPGLARPFSPVVEEIWRALNDGLLQQQGLGDEEIAKLRAEFDRVNDEMRKSWDNYRRVVGYYPSYARFQRVEPQQPAQSRLGVVVEPPTEPLIEQLGLPKGKGLVIRQVLENSAAARAGLRPNDLLMKFNDKAVSANPGEFRQQVQGLKANTPLTVEVLRKGKTETIKALTLP